MPIEPRWLDLDDIIETNRLEVEATGESFALVNRGLLESACARPKNNWAYRGEQDVIALAVALALGIARNHPFEQGNKRTGMTAAVMFIELNGYAWVAPDTSYPGEMMVKALLRENSEAAFAEAIRPFVVPS